MDIFYLGGKRRQRALEAAHHRLDASDEFTRAEGLGNVIVAAQFQAEDSIGLAAFGGQKNNRDRSERNGLTNLPAQFQAVFAWHHDIEQEQGGPLPFCVGDDEIARRIKPHIEVRALEMMAHETRNIGIVFHYEDGRFHATIVALKCNGSVTREASSRELRA